MQQSLYLFHSRLTFGQCHLTERARAQDHVYILINISARCAAMSVIPEPWTVEEHARDERDRNVL